MMLDAVNTYWKKGLRYFGLADEEEAANNYSSATTNMTEYQYPRLSDELPYQYFDAASNIFHNDHNAGIVYSLSPLTGGNESVAEELDAIIRTKISEEFTLQVILVKHNQVAPKIDRFAEQFSNVGLTNLGKLGESLEHYYKRAAATNFKTRDAVTTRLTQTDIFLVVDMPKGKRSESDIKIVLDRFKVTFQAALNASNIGFRSFDAIDFLHLLYFYTQHDPKNIYPLTVDYNERELLKSQTCGRAFALEVDERDKDHLVLSGDDEAGKGYTTDISVLTLDKMPASFQLWDNINNTANVFKPEYIIPCNHIISAVYSVDERGKALSKANRKTRDLTKKAKSEYATLVAGTEEQAAQWKTFRDDLTKQKTRSVKMLYNVILFSKPGERAEDVESAKKTFSFNGLKLAVCKRMQIPYFFVSMPFMYTGNLQYDFALPTMMHHISSWNATQYLPVLSDWQGQSKGVLLPSMRGQLAMIDPFSGFFGTNFNLAITGISGAGKSFATQMMMLTTLFDNGAVYIIDIGGSYRKLCEAVGGIYLEYQNLAMSPFTYVDNIHDSIDELVELFELLVCPKRGATDEDSAAIRMAVLNAFEKRNTKTLIDDVQVELEALHDPQRYPSAMTLAANIARYTSTAEHGKAFNLPSKLDPKARFIVVDLLEIKNKKHLIAPVLLSVFSQFRKRMMRLH